MDLENLQKRQLELLAIMTKSDAHSAKCSKLGISFKKEYPEEFDDYQKANLEYNKNEKIIEKLKEDEKNNLKNELKKMECMDFI